MEPPKQKNLARKNPTTSYFQMFRKKNPPTKTPIETNNQPPNEKTTRNAVYEIDFDINAERKNQSNNYPSKDNPDFFESHQNIELLNNNNNNPEEVKNEVVSVTTNSIENNFCQLKQSSFIGNKLVLEIELTPNYSPKDQLIFDDFKETLHKMKSLLQNLKENNRCIRKKHKYSLLSNSTSNDVSDTLSILEQVDNISRKDKANCKYKDLGELIELVESIHVECAEKKIDASCFIESLIKDYVKIKLFSDPDKSNVFNWGKQISGGDAETTLPSAVSLFDLEFNKNNFFSAVKHDNNTQKINERAHLKTNLPTKTSRSESQLSKNVLKEQTHTNTCTRGLTNENFEDCTLQNMNANKNLKLYSQPVYTYTSYNTGENSNNFKIFKPPIVITTNRNSSVIDENLKQAVFTNVRTKCLLDENLKPIRQTVFKNHCKNCSVDCQEDWSPLPGICESGMDFSQKLFEDTNKKSDQNQQIIEEKKPKFLNALPVTSSKGNPKRSTKYVAKFKPVRNDFKICPVNHALNPTKKIDKVTQMTSTEVLKKKQLPWTPEFDALKNNLLLFSNKNFVSESRTVDIQTEEVETKLIPGENCAFVNSFCDNLRSNPRKLNVQQFNQSVNNTLKPLKSIKLVQTDSCDLTDEEGFPKNSSIETMLSEVYRSIDGFEVSLRDNVKKQLEKLLSQKEFEKFRNHYQNYQRQKLHSTCHTTNYLGITTSSSETDHVPVRDVSD